MTAPALALTEQQAGYGIAAGCAAILLVLLLFVGMHYATRPPRRRHRR